MYQRYSILNGCEKANAFSKDSFNFKILTTRNTSRKLMSSSTDELIFKHKNVRKQLWLLIRRYIFLLELKASHTSTECSTLSLCLRNYRHIQHGPWLAPLFLLHCFLLHSPPPLFGSGVSFYLRWASANSGTTTKSASNLLRQFNNKCQLES